MSKPFLSIFTPTYNRAYILPRLYESLCKQTSKEFTWLIVDDGSVDDTESVVSKWIDDKLINIEYHKQPNGGKQRAHNTAVKVCKTECFHCVDSDDWLVPDAVEALQEAWETIKNKPNVSGIFTVRGKDENTPIGTSLPKNLDFSTFINIYQTYGFKGETQLTYKTEILKQYPFHIDDDEKFIVESYVYMQIDQNYTMYILDKILVIGEYLEDGYSSEIYRVIYNNPKSYMRFKKLSVELSINFKYKFLNSINLLSAYFITKKQHKNFKWDFLTLSAYLPGYLLYLKRFQKYDKKG